MQKLELFVSIRSTSSDRILTNKVNVNTGFEVNSSIGTTYSRRAIRAGFRHPTLELKKKKKKKKKEKR